MLPQNHPFYKFKEYFYLESGTNKMPIYIFKFDIDGILVELHLNDKENGPRGRLYLLEFFNEYDFDLVKSYPDIHAKSNDELYELLVSKLEMEVVRRYGIQR